MAARLRVEQLKRGAKSALPTTSSTDGVGVDSSAEAMAALEVAAQAAQLGAATEERGAAGRFVRPRQGVVAQGPLLEECELSNMMDDCEHDRL